MLEQVIAALAAGGLSGGLVVLILREWLSERLKQSIGAEYARQLENHKKDLELRLNDQVRLHKVYEDLSLSLEDVSGKMATQTPEEMGIVFHKMFALLAIYAPDDVYRHVRDAFYIKGTRTVYARDFRPVVYHAIRKSLLGAETQLSPTDMIDNIEVLALGTPKPQANSK